MESLLYARYLPKLSFLHATSQAQVLSYLSLLQARHYAPGTGERVVTILKKFCFSVPEPRQAVIHGNLAPATVQDVDGFIKAASAQGRAPATINTALSLLKAFVDFLHEEGQMPHQPILRHRHRLMAPATLPKPIPEADLLRFCTVIDAVRDRLIFLLMLRCGLRVSEVSPVTWEDSDVRAKTLRINNSQGQVDRVVYLAPDVEQSLTRWRARRSAQRYVFPGREKGTMPLSRQQIFWLMKKYLRWAKLPRQYSPHWLRQSLRHPAAQRGGLSRGPERVDGPPLDAPHAAVHPTLRRDETTPR